MGDLTVWQIAEFLAAPFAASLILTGIHTYLGLHVLERGVIQEEGPIQQVLSSPRNEYTRRLLDAAPRLPV